MRLLSRVWWWAGLVGGQAFADGEADPQARLVSVMAVLRAFWLSSDVCVVIVVWRMLLAREMTGARLVLFDGWVRCWRALERYSARLILPAAVVRRERFILLGPALFSSLLLLSAALVIL